jgi:choline dehydrogenase
MRYDVIVVGAGAGAVVARRLVEDAGATVLLVEAGGEDTNPAIHDPGRTHELWFSEDDWAYMTVPQEGCAGRRLHIPRGKVLGGSSSLNGMIYIRGAHADYDHWAYLGNAGWGYRDVLPIFKRSEDFDLGDSEYHGAGGPLPVTTRYEPHPVCVAVVEAAGEAGVPFNPDHNGAELDGAGFAQLTVRDGKRRSTAQAFLGPVLGSPGLTVLTNTPVTRLLLEGTRCVGVQLVRDGKVETAYADSEVVVCAGAIESPKLLLLSGIGSPEQLGRHGIDVVVDLPGVGENLHDHFLAPFIWSSPKPVPPLVPGTTMLHSHLFWRSRSGLIAPDLQPLAFHVPMYSEEWMSGPADGFTLMAGVIRPASRGSSIRLASPDPLDAPLVDPAFLDCDADLDAAVAAAELCREIGNQPALREWAGEELYPGPGVRTARELGDYLRRTVLTYHHQVGTCKMGVDADAVVDPELRVYGTTGLRVADASVMPTVTSGNTYAASILIGERAADFVKASLGTAVAATASTG